MHHYRPNGGMTAQVRTRHMTLIERTNAYFVVSVLSAVIAAAMWALVPYQVEEQVMLFSFGGAGLDPKAFPYLVTALWFGISLWNIAEALRSNEDSDVSLSGSLTPSVLITVAISFVYALTLEPLGFVVSSGVVVGGLALFFGAREWLAILFVAFGVPGAIFVVFTRLLHVSLPPFPAWMAGG